MKECSRCGKIVTAWTGKGLCMDCSKNMDVREIVKHWLKENGYEGLYSDQCGCDLEDLMPCCNDGALSCQPGYKVMGCPEECGEGCAFHIEAEKPTTSDKVVERCKHNGIKGECLICYSEESKRPATPQEVEEWGQAEREDLGGF